MLFLLLVVAADQARFGIATAERPADNILHPLSVEFESCSGYEAQGLVGAIAAWEK